MTTNRFFERTSRAKTGANHSEKRLVILGQEQKVDRFRQQLKASDYPLQKSRIDVLQINLGKMCNLACEHCHVEAGPNRTEMMEEGLLVQLLEIVRQLAIRTVDLTGGAPEMYPNFRKFVEAFRALDCEVIVRSNLSILLQPGYEDLPAFFAAQRVRVVASLPCYTQDNVDAQRGEGVFAASIEALLRLNRVGYGIADSQLFLDLVYNPGGPSLPGPERDLEQAYKQRLHEDFGISFNSLYAITNLPIGRFYSDLKKAGTAAAYDELLQQSFNPATISRLMCRSTLNVSWDGWVYDCDFNQMVELPALIKGRPLHVSEVLGAGMLEGLEIQTGNHCFGCTAGAGSSCSGELL